MTIHTSTSKFLQIRPNCLNLVPAWAAWFDIPCKNSSRLNSSVLSPSSSLASVLVVVRLILDNSRFTSLYSSIAAIVDQKLCQIQNWDSVSIHYYLQQKQHWRQAHQRNCSFQGVHRHQWYLRSLWQKQHHYGLLSPSSDKICSVRENE